MTREDEAAEAIRKYEARKLTADGFFWPVARCFMRHSGNIRARMIEDLLPARLTASGASLGMLYVAGWTMAQVEACGAQALADFRALQADRRRK
jgi:hypothetical protein